MTVTVRAVARRCDRCRRMVHSSRRSELVVDGRPVARTCLCGRCRSELVDSLDRFMREAQ